MIEKNPVISTLIENWIWMDFCWEKHSNKHAKLLLITLHFIFGKNFSRWNSIINDFWIFTLFSKLWENRNGKTCVHFADYIMEVRNEIMNWNSFAIWFYFGERSNWWVFWNIRWERWLKMINNCSQIFPIFPHILEYHL